MIAETILFELLECGITPSVTPDGNGIEVEAGLLNDAQRAAIRANKYELIACIQDAARITSELMTRSHACMRLLARLTPGQGADASGDSGNQARASPGAAAHVQDRLPQISKDHHDPTLQKTGRRKQW